MLTRSRRIIIRCAQSLQLKHSKQLSPKLLHKLKHTASKSSSSYIVKGASGAVLSVYLTTNVVPYEWKCGLFGGAMIGASSVLFILFHGRIAGISGLVTKTMDSILPNRLASCSQLGFVCGMMASGVYWNWRNINIDNNKGIQLPCVNHRTQPFEHCSYAPIIMAISGLLVGFGTRFGSGCTTGHGICGLSRMSVRSLAAVSSFFGTSVITATVLDTYCKELYTISKQKQFKSKQLLKFSQYGVPLITAALFGVAIYSGMRGIGNENILSIIPSTICGFGLGTGLIYSGMSKPSKIRTFLDWDKNDFTQHFDPSLGFVFFGALVISVPLFPLIMKSMRYPILSKLWHLPTNTKIDKQLMIGSTIFGLGWGVGSLCPGPGLLGICSTEYGSPFYIWVLAFILGNRLVVFL